MNPPNPVAAYVAAVVTLYMDMPDTPMRISASDQWLARHFYQDGVPLGRLIRPPDSPRLAPIRSLAYFRPVIEELQENPAPENYREYLKMKLRIATQRPPAEAQKNTFSDDR
jgi:hypothetical protein